MFIGWKAVDSIYPFFESSLGEITLGVKCLLNTSVHSKQLAVCEEALKEPQKAQLLRSFFREKNDGILSEMIERKGNAKKHIKERGRIEICFFKEDFLLI